MNKLAKGLLLSLVIATPVAFAAPTFQAEAATPHETHNLVAAKTKTGKVVKHKNHKHHVKQHVKSKADKK